MSNERDEMQNQLAVHSVCYRPEPLEVALDGIARSGVERVEIAAIPGLAEHWRVADGERGAAKLVQRLKEYGLALSSVSVHSNLTTAKGASHLAEAIKLTPDFGDYAEHVHRGTQVKGGHLVDLCPQSTPAGRQLPRVRRHDCPQAVAGVSFGMRKGVCTALVGESGAAPGARGSGKTTTLRCIAGLHAPTSRALLFNGGGLHPRARERFANKGRPA